MPAGRVARSAAGYGVPALVVVSFILFFLGGLVFGYAAPGKLAWLALLLPLGLALIAAFEEGIDGGIVLRLILALLVTAVGVLLGELLDRRGAGAARLAGG